MLRFEKLASWRRGDSLAVEKGVDGRDGERAKGVPGRDGERDGDIEDAGSDTSSLAAVPTGRNM